MEWIAEVEEGRGVSRGQCKTSLARGLMFVKPVQIWKWHVVVLSVDWLFFSFTLD